MTARARVACWLAALAVLCAPAVAAAAPTIEVQPIQGVGAPWVMGWNEAVVSIDNSGGAFRGEVLVQMQYEVKDLTSAIVRVPVSLAAGENARVILPFFSGPGGFPTVVLAMNGEVIDSRRVGTTEPMDTTATVVEINLTNPMRDRLIAPPAPPTTPSPPTPTHGYGDDDDDEEIKKPPPPIPKLGTGTGFVSAPVVASAIFAHESGDPILPDIAPAWGGAALVVVPSDVLNRVQGKQRDALLAYVNAGGTLAIEVAHEEDLRGDFVKTLVGGDARLTSTSSAQYAGGKLRRSAGITGGDEGDVATYGLGEVWLLHHDPWSRPPDPKSPASLYAIYARARERRRAFPVAHDLHWIADDKVRQLLDPNFGFRPALGIAAALVLVYALFVGPFAFARARKSKKPLSVLRAVPLAAVVLFVSLVVLGQVGKGFRGRVRKLELVDVASGANVGTTTTFHAFYVGDPSSIDLVSSSPVNGLHLVDPYDANSPIDLDRTGIAVRNVRAHPWQTVALAEEGERAIDGNVTLEGNDLRLKLTNNTSWTLEHVVLYQVELGGDPNRARYFAKVAPGESVVARDGLLVQRGVVPTALHDTGPLSNVPNDRTRAAFEAINVLEGSRDPLPRGDMQVATMLAHPPSSTEGGYSIDDDVVYLRVFAAPAGAVGESPPEKPTGKEDGL